MPASAHEGAGNAISLGTLCRLASPLQLHDCCCQGLSQCSPTFLLLPGKTRKFASIDAAFEKVRGSIG